MSPRQRGRRARSREQAPISAVVERMERIAAELSPTDGVARFNDLYLTVTREVAAEAAAPSFEDAAFVADLDVVFADLYFAAIDAAARAAVIPRAWAPLFQARGRRRVAPIQFALAGMNAHINHDLALALVETHRRHGIEPRRRSAQHRDYLKVNAILERVEERVKERLATGLVGVADEALGRLDDVIAIWKVARARDAAWTHAETLWVLQDLPSLREAFLLTLARTVGLAGRGLLVPTL
jgi:hypothetical protein